MLLTDVGNLALIRAAEEELIKNKVLITVPNVDYQTGGGSNIVCCS